VHRYHFSLNISLALPDATEFPVEFAFANFLYWHSREDDVILVLQDDYDVFGTTALYCGRRVLIAPLHVQANMASPADELRFIHKAYETMAILKKQKKAYFVNYKADAAFATISQLVKNTRCHPSIDGLTILTSQTQDEGLRFQRTEWLAQDMATPCKMVQHTQQTANSKQKRISHTHA
jgi:hypothetical protein